jgi:hypothetical protein
LTTTANTVLNVGFGVFLNQWTYSVQPAFAQTLPLFLSKTVNAAADAVQPTFTTGKHAAGSGEWHDRRRRTDVMPVSDKRLQYLVGRRGVELLCGRCSCEPRFDRSAFIRDRHAWNHLLPERRNNHNYFSKSDLFTIQGSIFSRRPLWYR